MAELFTTYLGFTLRNPLIAASCGLTNSVDSIKKLADNGIGAIVLKSLFEEQILFYENQKLSENQLDYPEAYDYIRNYTKTSERENYLTLIKEAKKAVSIPIIASINCITSKEWTSFAKDIENAGADALELNIMHLGINEKHDSKDIENKFFDIIQKVREHTKLPIAVKISNHYTSLGNMLVKLDWTKLVQGVVLFNRQYLPDIDIDKKKITTGKIFSNPTDYHESLRWIGILSSKVNLDLAATTGIWNGKAVIKQLLAGAKAVQIASVLYQKGPEAIKTILSELENWMINHTIQNIEQFRGQMNMKNIDHPSAFERIQFMRYFSNIE